MITNSCLYSPKLNLHSWVTLTKISYCMSTSFPRFVSLSVCQVCCDQASFSSRGLFVENVDLTRSCFCLLLEFLNYFAAIIIQYFNAGLKMNRKFVRNRRKEVEGALDQNKSCIEGNIWFSLISTFHRWNQSGKDCISPKDW